SRQVRRPHRRSRPAPADACDRSHGRGRDDPDRLERRQGLRRPGREQRAELYLGVREREARRPQLPPAEERGQDLLPPEDVADPEDAARHLAGRFSTAANPQLPNLRARLAAMPGWIGAPELLILLLV